MKSSFIKFLILSIGIILGFNIATSQKVAFIKSSAEDSISRFIKKPSFSNIAKKCEVQEQKNNLLTAQQTIIIGHAYGSSKNHDGNISAYVSEFLEHSSDQYKEIIFTGDIIYAPSKKKWNELKEFLKNKGLKMYIAPGNHDVGNSLDNGYRDIFFQEFSTSFPIIEERENKIMIFLDSTISPGKIDSEIVKFLENSTPLNKTVFIFSHHLLRPQPQLMANGLTGHNLSINNIDVLHQAKENFKNIFLISGDSGVTSNKVDCLKFQNIFFISSGIGETNDDQVLILDGTEILKKKLRQ